jgi:hydroxyacyl-ACP dehydratase HTD2-like protein with hotdog domain
MKISSAIVGREAGPDEQRIDARWLMAYSAGLGERNFPHPLFPVCYEWPATRQLRERAGLVPIDARLVHAQHDLVIHRPAKEETLFISGKVVAALQRKPGTLVVYRFMTRDEKKQLVSTTDFSALYRDAKLEGGDRVSDKVEDPPRHSGALNGIGDISVAATAAHVYTECARIWNPIHTDVAYARAAGLPDIILHGTATLALSVSKVLNALKIKRVQRIRCRFAGMVMMPSTLTVQASRIGDAIAFETRNASGEAVIERGWIG